MTPRKNTLNRVAEDKPRKKSKVKFSKKSADEGRSRSKKAKTRKSRSRSVMNISSRSVKSNKILKVKSARSERSVKSAASKKNKKPRSGITSKPLSDHNHETTSHSGSKSPLSASGIYVQTIE